MTQTAHITRRAVLGGAAAVGGAAVLAACGSDTGTDTGTDADSGASPDTGTDTDAGTGTDAGGESLVSTADVPVGGGVIVGAVVVTQPSDGEFKAFSSTCTHQGCRVSSVSAEAITCACHGSSFSVGDGSVLTGPATAPLPEVAVEVSGDQVVRA
jgi:Rieske Fe-S protein